MRAIDEGELYRSWETIGRQRSLRWAIDPFNGCRVEQRGPENFQMAVVIVRVAQCENNVMLTEMRQKDRAFSASRFDGISERSQFRGAPFDRRERRIG